MRTNVHFSSVRFYEMDSRGLEWEICTHQHCWNESVSNVCLLCHQNVIWRRNWFIFIYCFTHRRILLQNRLQCLFFFLISGYNGYQSYWYIRSSLVASRPYWQKNWISTSKWRGKSSYLEIIVKLLLQLNTSWYHFDLICPR